jgi:hypothetical protein
MSLIDDIKRNGRKYKKLDGIYVNGEYYEDILLEEAEDRGFRVNIDVSMHYENFYGDYDEDGVEERKWKDMYQEIADEFDYVSLKCYAEENSLEHIGTCKNCSYKGECKEEYGIEPGIFQKKAWRRILSSKMKQ